MKVKANKNYIIIATLLLLLIIGIVVLNTTEILKKTGKSAEQIAEAEARTKLEQALQNTRTQKESDANYNSSEYLTSLLQGQNIIVSENIVSIDGYSFEIDRENLSIIQSLGKSQVTVQSEVLEILGKNDAGKYRAKVQITVTSNVPIHDIIFENENGTFSKERTTELTYTKEMEIELDKQYVVTVATKDGKVNTNIIEQSSKGIFIPIEPENYGQYVDYEVDIDGNTSNYDWQIFYQEDDKTSPNYGATYIIADYYVPASKMTTSLSKAGMKQYSGSTYRVYWNSVPTYQSILDGTDITKPNVKQIFMYDYTGTSNNNVKCVSTLLNPDNWKDDFVTTQLQEKGGMAIGGPTLNMWCASWNKAYEAEKITPSIPDGGTGYQVNGSTWADLSSYTGYKTDAPNVYFPTKSQDSDGSYGYWLASPSSGNSDTLMNVRYNGSVNYYYYISNSFGVRPLVYLPSSITLEPSGTANLWNINYGE